VGLFGIFGNPAHRGADRNAPGAEAEAARSDPLAREFRLSAGPIARGSLLGFLIGIHSRSAHIISSFVRSASSGACRSIRAFRQGRDRGRGRAGVGQQCRGDRRFRADAGARIPTSPVTAVMNRRDHGARHIAGPMLIQEQPELFWGFVASMYVGNVVLLSSTCRWWECSSTAAHSVCLSLSVRSRLLHPPARIRSPQQ